MLWPRPEAVVDAGTLPSGRAMRALSRLEQFVYRRAAHLITVTEPARQNLIETYPFFNPATIPAGTYRNQDQDIESLNVGAMHLIAAANADEELVYQVTKTLYENRESVVEKHAAGRAINAENVVRDTGTEFHPGAIRYYREIGIWPEGR